MADWPPEFDTIGEEFAEVNRKMANPPEDDVDEDAE